MSVPLDIDALAELNARRERNVAATYMPMPVLLAVVNTTVQRSAGWVICERDGPGGSRVRCLVPNYWDLSPSDGNTAQYVIWALPLNGKAEGAEYIALWPAWNGADADRTPRVTGGSYLVTTSIVVTTTLTALSDVVLVDASAGNVIINLPAAASVRGKQYWVKKVDSGGNSVTIDGNGSETIDGSGTKSTSTQYNGWHIVSNGTNWFILGTP